jgi:hypothetical protein
MKCLVKKLKGFKEILEEVEEIILKKYLKLENEIKTD